mmetsp:Transcript_1049/g.1435  ORF Transcript_1049/g.1435 Transcript_1049/m.1435 type:complete len:201 (+) Transcript_1049:669-1271(+)
MDLASHCVGQYVLRKTYEASDLRGKEKWAQLLSTALANDKEGLQISNKDRNIWKNCMEFVSAEVYLSDPVQWRTAVKKSLKSLNLIQELDKVSSGAGSKNKVAELIKKSEDNKSDAINTTNTEVKDQAAVGVQKRKRNRKGKQVEVKDNNSLKESSEVLNEELVVKPSVDSNPSEEIVVTTAGGKKRKRRRTKGNKQHTE